MKNSARKKTIVAKVISDKMNKAVTVEWETRKIHPLYKKFVTRHEKLKARDEKNEAEIGDVVRIMESRPLSKDISWRVVEVLEKAQKG